jgi:hypothetical protein
MDRVLEIRASHPLGKACQGKRTAHLAPGIGNRGNPLGIPGTVYSIETGLSC